MTFTWSSEIVTLNCTLTKLTIYSIEEPISILFIMNWLISFERSFVSVHMWLGWTFMWLWVYICSLVDELRSFDLLGKDRNQLEVFFVTENCKLNLVLIFRWFWSSCMWAIVLIWLATFHKCLTIDISWTTKIVFTFELNFDQSVFTVDKEWNMWEVWHEFVVNCGIFGTYSLLSSLIVLFKTVEGWRADCLMKEHTVDTTSSLSPLNACNCSPAVDGYASCL